MIKKVLALLTLAGALAVTGSAYAGPSLFVGFSDDSLKFEPSTATAAAADLGAKAFRVTLAWSPGQSDLSAADIADFNRAVAGASGFRIVVSVYADRGDKAPVAEAAREEYCTYVKNLLVRYPAVNDVVIWNEPNKQFFWKPQYNADGTSAAPAAYTALLARCWDVLHAARPGVNVVAAATAPRGNDRANAVSNVSHSPGAFIRKMGEAFRAGGRQQRLFDTVGHHAYGEHSAERPWRQHTGSTTVSEGDWDKLMQALHDAYHGTAQPIPGQGVAIWYLEMGYQTRPDDAKASLYVGGESDARALVDDDATSGWNAETPPVGGETVAPDQATQIVDGVRLAFCQPYVEAFFNLQLWDERDLGRWQSAPLWADRTRKDSYDAFKQVIAEVNAKGVDCSKLKSTVPQGFSARTIVAVETVQWPKAKQGFNWRNTLWRFRIKAAEDATYRASIRRVGGRRPAGARGAEVLRAQGELKQGYFVFVKFPQRRLPAGRYEMRIVLTSKENAARKSTLAGPRFVVKPRPRRR